TDSAQPLRQQILLHNITGMSMVVHLVVVWMAVLLVSGAPQYGQSDGCGLWWQRPCPSESRYCDTWCEYPMDSGRFKCCDIVPTGPRTPELECPIDPRRPEDCNIFQVIETGARSGFRGTNYFAPPLPPPTECFSYYDCPSGLGCCYDACLGKTCKHPAPIG
ncbi:unnamed protein product, partial [Meganyctiphanes norvegica]